MTVLIRQIGYKFTVTQAGLVQRHVFADILKEEDILVRMSQLIPSLKITQMILVIITQGGGFQKAEIRNTFNAYLMTLKVILLKKRRTLQ